MSAIPEGMPTLIPSLSVKDATKAIALYKQAFGATEDYCMEDPKSGQVMHACLTMGTSKIFVADEFPGCPVTSSSFYMYMPDVDTALDQAKKAGLKETMPVQDMFWGDRNGSVMDEFGINWCLATHKRDVSPEELEKGRDEWLAKMEKNVTAA